MLSPGRLNETWFKAEREGLFYGQCSELCGKDHAFMPIAIRVGSEDKYKQWLDGRRYRPARRPTRASWQQPMVRRPSTSPKTRQ